MKEEDSYNTIFNDYKAKKLKYSEFVKLRDDHKKRMESIKNREIESVNLPDSTLKGLLN